MALHLVVMVTLFWLCTANPFKISFECIWMLALCGTDRSIRPSVCNICEFWQKCDIRVTDSTPLRSSSMQLTASWRRLPLDATWTPEILKPFVARLLFISVSVCFGASKYRWITVIPELDISLHMRQTPNCLKFAIWHSSWKMSVACFLSSCCISYPNENGVVNLSSTAAEIVFFCEHKLAWKWVRCQT